MKNRLNNKKSRLIRGKIAKSLTTFRKNKPNSKNIKIGVSSFITSKYEISPTWRSKNQTQFKPNLLQRYNWFKLFYDRQIREIWEFGGEKTNPNKPKFYPRFRLILLFCRGTNPISNPIFSELGKFIQNHYFLQFPARKEFFKFFTKFCCIYYHIMSYYCISTKGN